MVSFEITTHDRLQKDQHKKNCVQRKPLRTKSEFFFLKSNHEIKPQICIYCRDIFLQTRLLCSFQLRVFLAFMCSGSEFHVSGPRSSYQNLSK